MERARRAVHGEEFEFAGVRFVRDDPPTTIPNNQRLRLWVRDADGHRRAYKGNFVAKTGLDDRRLPRSSHSSHRHYSAAAGLPVQQTPPVVSSVRTFGLVPKVSESDSTV